MPLRILVRFALGICLLQLPLAVAQTGDQIDWDRAKQLHRRFVQGEKLTEEEQVYHDRAAKALRAKSKPVQPMKPPGFDS